MRRHVPYPYCSEFCLSLLVTTVVANAGERENPYYKTWASQKPGTSVTVRCTRKIAPSDAITLVTSTLTDVSAKGCKITVKTFEELQGQKKRKLSVHAQTVTREMVNSKDNENFRGEMEGAKEEQVTVPAGTFAAKVFAHIFEAVWGQRTSNKIWFSAEVPGGNLKTEFSEGPSDDLKITSTTELIAVDRK